MSELLGSAATACSYLCCVSVCSAWSSVSSSASTGATRLLSTSESLSSSARALACILEASASIISQMACSSAFAASWAATSAPGGADDGCCGATRLSRYKDSSDRPSPVAPATGGALPPPPLFPPTEAVRPTENVFTEAAASNRGGRDGSARWVLTRATAGGVGGMVAAAAATLWPIDWTVKLARRSMRETMSAGVPAKMCWKSQTKEACISPCTRARTPCRSSQSSASRICCSAKLCSSRTMSTMEEKARPTDSPAEPMPSSSSSQRECRAATTCCCCCFFRFSIRSDSGSPTLLALRSTLAGHPPQPAAPAGCTPTAAASSSILFMNSASPPPIPSKLALSAHLAGVRARRGRRTITPVPQFRGERDLASPAHPPPPPPPPRKAGNGREEVEGDDEAEEERAHGDGATAATWKPMTLFRCGVGRGLERPRLADWPFGWATTARGRCGNSRTAAGGGRPNARKRRESVGALLIKEDPDGRAGLPTLLVNRPTCVVTVRAKPCCKPNQKSLYHCYKIRIVVDLNCFNSIFLFVVQLEHAPLEYKIGMAITRGTFYILYFNIVWNKM